MEILDLETWEPATQTVTCGNRADLVKKERRHRFADMGVDTRHDNDGCSVPMLIASCVRCGREKRSLAYLAVKEGKCLVCKRCAFYGVDFATDSGLSGAKQMANHKVRHELDSDLEKWRKGW